MSYDAYMYLQNYECEPEGTSVYISGNQCCYDC